MASLFQILFCDIRTDQQEDQSVEMPTIDSVFFGRSPSQVLYNIEVSRSRDNQTLFSGRSENAEL